MNLAGWSLRDKIGQMVMAGFDGKAPTDEIRALIRERKLGGVIYSAGTRAAPPKSPACRPRCANWLRRRRRRRCGSPSTRKAAWWCASTRA